MDFNKKQPGDGAPDNIGVQINWGVGLRFPKRPVRLPGIDGVHSSLLPNGDIELDLDYFVIGEDGKPKCLSRAAALTYTGDQRSGRDENSPDELIHICVTYPCPDSSHRTPNAPKHHVCKSAKCVHDNLSAPRVTPANNGVMPLWQAPLVKRTV